MNAPLHGNETRSYFHSGLHLRTPTNGSFGTTKGAMFARAKSRKALRMIGYLMAAKCSPGTSAALPRYVELVRVAPRELDSDNLQSAFKSIRDGVADFFAVKDNKSCPFEWRYAQRKNESGHPLYGVEIRMEW